MFNPELAPLPMQEPRSKEEKTESIQKPKTEKLFFRIPRQNEDVNGGRIRFYTPGRIFKNPDSFSANNLTTMGRIRIKDSIDYEKDTLTGSRDFYGSHKKSPELVNELNQCIDRITRFAQSVGVRLTRERFPAINDIHMRAGSKTEGTTGESKLNEMEFVGDDTEEIRISRAQHELIHMACKYKYFVDGFRTKQIVGGLTSEKGANLSFEEGLTELTNEQISLENGMRIAEPAYECQMILISTLVRDITEKLNSCSLEELSRFSKTGSADFQNKIKKITATSEEERGERFTKREILGYFQAGMFHGDRACLNLIGSIYGKDKKDAISKMKDEPQDIARLAKDFGFNDAAETMALYAACKDKTEKIEMINSVVKSCI